MAFCCDCKKTIIVKNNYIYVDERDNEWPICRKCADNHFVCPECGKVYPDYTYDYNGYCKACDSKH